MRHTPNHILVIQPLFDLLDMFTAYMCRYVLLFITVHSPFT